MRTRQYHASISDAFGFLDESQLQDLANAPYADALSRLLQWLRDGGWDDPFFLLRSTSTEYYDYQHQGESLADASGFTISPGDSVLVDCYYNTNGGKRFGLESSDEMCIDFVYYYPRKAATSSICDGTQGGAGYSMSQPSGSDTEQSFTDRTFGEAPPALALPSAPPSPPPPASPADPPTRIFSRLLLWVAAALERLAANLYQMATTSRWAITKYTRKS